MLRYGLLIEIVDINKKYTLDNALSHANYRKSAVLTDVICVNINKLLSQASAGRYFNKTYQWFLWYKEGKQVESLISPDIDYLGPNAQITLINGSNSMIQIWNVYSVGKHLRNPLKLSLINFSPFKKSSNKKIGNNIMQLQYSRKRNQFHGAILRGATVVSS